MEATNMLAAIVKKARKHVLEGNPLEADALMKNFCDWHFECRESEQECVQCPIDAYIEEIMPLCEAQRRSERLREALGLEAVSVTAS
jgi:hypothetical protein